MGGKIPPAIPRLNALDIATKRSASWWDTVFAPLDADDVPTITVSTTQQTTGDLITPSASLTDAYFRYDGCIGVTSPASGYVWSSASTSNVNYYCNPEFVTVSGSDTIELRVHVPSAGNKLGVRVIVDGKLHSLTLDRFISTPSSAHYIKIVFPTSRVRQIAVELESISRFGGVIVPTGHTITRPPRSVRRPFGIIGDSFCRGADYANDGASGLETFAYYVARLSGADRIVNFALGGTGWSNPGSNSIFGSHTAEVLSSGVAALIAVGSRNDNSYTSQLAADAFAALDALSPIHYIAVGGPAQVAFSTVNDKVRDATSRAGREFVDVLDVIDSSLVHTDNIHPSAAGHVALAKAFYAGMSRLKLDSAFAIAVASRQRIDLTTTASPASPQTPGTSVTFTGTLSSSASGSVAFIVDGLEVSRGTVSGTTATYTTSSLTTTTHNVITRLIPDSAAIAESVSSTISYIIATGFDDQFTRADGAVGSPWVTSGNGSWTITSNQLGNTTIASGSGYCVRDAGVADGTLEFEVAGTPGNGLYAVFRYQSVNNLLRIGYNSGAPTLYKVVGGSSTLIAACTGGAWAASDVIQVVLSGTTVVVKKNGTTVLTQTVTEFSDKTFHGVGCGSTGTAGTFEYVTFTP